MLETLRSRERVLWLIATTVVALALFLSTLQADINGSRHAYAKDVGEIQNALPRWGLIHYSGYPLYTATASLFVNALWGVGVEPAASASLYSAIWGAVTVGLLSVLAHELGVSWSASALGALTVAASRSVWVDSSLAEVHTLTLALTVATLIFAVRFGRDGDRRSLLLLTFLFSQGVMHQRSVLLLTPAVALLIWPYLRDMWRHLGSVIGVSILAPLTYLYMPFRVWTGADWVFGSPETWEGFWAMIFDNRADRVVRWPVDFEQWLMRGRVTLQIIADDMWWPLLLMGLAGLLLLGFKDRRWREGLALTLAWAPNVPLTFLIWEGGVRDAQLAAKLPVVLMAGVGLALVISWLRQRSRPAGVLASAVLLAALSVWGWRVRPFVLSITRDDSAKAVIAKAERVAPPPDGEPATLALPWGHDYWAVAYAKYCRNQLPGLGVVDHNANFRAIVKRGDYLLVLSETLYVFPIPWWEKELGPLYISSAAPGVIELSPTPPVDTAAVPADIAFNLGNGIRVRSLSMEQRQGNELFVSIYWEATKSVEENYRIALHLVARDPPTGAEDILAQADSPHPVSGWFPTSQWDVGDVVRDDYVLNVPSDASPVAVRVAMYRINEDDSFDNTAWLSRPYRRIEK
ncbi:MAG: DUF2723 domain-containing protein [Anaerolineae bacterium]|jgi:hypothetical protein